MASTSSGGVATGPLGSPFRRSRRDPGPDLVVGHREGRYGSRSESRLTPGTGRRASPARIGCRGASARWRHAQALPARASLLPGCYPNPPPETRRPEPRAPSLTDSGLPNWSGKPDSDRRPSAWEFDRAPRAPRKWAEIGVSRLVRSRRIPFGWGRPCPNLACGQLLRRRSGERPSATTRLELAP